MKNMKYWILVGLLTVSTLVEAGGITGSAGSTKKDNQMGQMVNLASGALNFYQAKVNYSACSSGCGGCCALAAIYTIMGIQNMSQAGAQKSTANQASGTIGQTDINLPGSGYDPEAINQLENDPVLKDGLAFVGTVTNADPAKGFSYDPATRTATLANGKTIKSEDVSSASAMAAAGMSSGLIDTVTSMEQKIAAAAMKKASKLAAKYAVNGEEENSTGGGGGSGLSSASNSDDGLGIGLGAGSGAGVGLGINRDPAQVAGMQKNYNGEPIGVSGDSIFKMMTRRYKTKESQNNFLEESELLIQK